VLTLQQSKPTLPNLIKGFAMGSDLGLKNRTDKVPHFCF